VGAVWIRPRRGRLGRRRAAEPELVDRVAHGAGPGLAITEAIARAHGGTAALANDPAGGVTVTISLADAAPRGAAARERAT
jgi:signal transduction histidine kinase